MKLWQPQGKTRCSERPRKASMVGRVYEVPSRSSRNRTSGAAGSWQAFPGGLVRVVAQGAGWPTNVLVERVRPLPPRGRFDFLDPDKATAAGDWEATGERFVRPARGMKRVDKATRSR